jgi:hypothetical protein
MYQTRSSSSCFSFLLASASQKLKAETNSTPIELAFEKLDLEKIN